MADSLGEDVARGMRTEDVVQALTSKQRTIFRWPAQGSSTTLTLMQDAQRRWYGTMAQQGAPRGASATISQIRRRLATRSASMLITQRGRFEEDPFECLHHRLRLKVTVAVPVLLAYSIAIKFEQPLLKRWCIMVEEGFDTEAVEVKSSTPLIGVHGGGEDGAVERRELGHSKPKGLSGGTCV
eukprot:CAMPEP_0119323616 /NCGR_PEP_ID=MMETSP1333-20130426/61124_1 /TAXON_ID=418940 /ORGANISM="Scyphosphaera apsteinii, Strain RCC1455" /LENGTH=182 /DNA_ID=CAMNT_0007331105 /DNA_START=76 /DNA_END=621 /DNA_ORIENTATION=-